MLDDDYYMDLAIVEAKKSLESNGIPIGAVLVNNDGEIVSKGYNKLIQKDSVILHAEMDAIENAGRLFYDDYKNLTLYTTLSPCPMCSGAIVLYNIPRVVIGDNISLKGAEEFLLRNNVEVKVLNNQDCRDLFLDYVKNSSVWMRELERVGNSTESL